jgi:hypothetical protein
MSKKAKDKDIISERVIQYIDDPKDSSALAKIHEMSNKAKHGGKSPTQAHSNRLINVEENEPKDKTDKNKDNKNFNRRTLHFATVKPQNLNLFNKNKDGSDKNVGKNINKNTIGSNSNIRKSYKPEYVWDKSINRLVEKGTENKRKFKNDTAPIKEDKEKEEKEEIIEKLKQYRKNKGDAKTKKRISIKIPKENKKEAEIVYEKKFVQDGEEEEIEKESKNTKIFKKIVKKEPGSKVVITKKVIEEEVEQKDDKLVFDDSSDEEDIKKELKKLKINASDLAKGNVKVKIITEEYDEDGNKIFSKEITTNKLPKGLKGNNEIMDEFEKFENEFDD